MNFELIKIRLFQFRRIITDLGLFRALFLVILGVVVIVPLFVLTADKDSALLVAGVMLIVVYTMHTKRKDLHFLKVNVEVYVKLLFTEYCVLATPVIIGLLYHLQFLIAILLVLSIFIIAKFINPLRNKSLNPPISLSLTHPLPFEWVSGLRTYFWWLLIILFVAVAGSFWIGTIPVCMIFYSLITLSFNEKNEPLNLVLVFEKSPVAFLAQKIKNHLSLYSLPLIPLFIMFMIFHYQYWYLFLLTYLILAAVQAYSVLAKYSFYVPNTRSGGQPFNILGALSVFLPFLLPLILVLSIRFYIRSVSNLNQYLDDYN